MALEEDLRQIIQQMRAQGISDDDIRATLRDMGVDEALITKLLGEKAAPQPPSPSSPAPAPTSEPASAPEPTPEPSPPPEIAALAAVEASSRVEELEKKVQTLHEKLDKTPLADDIAEIKEMIRELRRDLEEIRGMMNGFKKILQEILETGRSVLVSLQNR